MAEDLRIELDLESAKLLEKLIDQSEPEVFLRELLSFFGRHAQVAAAHVVRTQLSGQKLGRRTGSLARSIIGVPQIVEGLPAFRVGVLRGPAIPYAGIHERGGEIRPRVAKNLAIPQDPVLTRAGVSKYGSPRNYPGELRFLPFRRGLATGKLVSKEEAALYESQGESPYLAEALWILVKKVRIKAKWYLRDGVLDYIPILLRSMVSFIRVRFRARDEQGRFLS